MMTALDRFEKYDGPKGLSYEKGTGHFKVLIGFNVRDGGRVRGEEVEVSGPSLTSVMEMAWDRFDQWQNESS